MMNSSSGLPGWSAARNVDDEFCRGLAAAHVLNTSECNAQGYPCDCIHLIRDTWTEIGGLGRQELFIVSVSQFITLMNLSFLLLKKLVKYTRVHDMQAIESGEDEKLNRKSLYYKVQLRSLLLQNVVFILNIIIQFFLMFTTLNGSQGATYSVMDGNCTNDEGAKAIDSELYALYDIRVYGVAGIMLTLFAMILNFKLTFDVYYGTLKKPTLSIVQVVMVGFVLTIALVKYLLSTTITNRNMDSLFAAMPGGSVDGIAWSVKSFEFEKTDMIHSTCPLLIDWPSAG